MGWVKDWIVRRSMGGGSLKKGRFLSVGLAVAPQQWNARLPLSSLFAAALLDSLGYYQMAESTRAESKRSIEGEGQRRRETIQQEG